jgi:hypothetical protein
MTLRRGMLGLLLCGLEGEASSYGDKLERDQVSKMGFWVELNFILDRCLSADKLEHGRVPVGGGYRG